MGLDMSIIAKANPKQKIEICRWRKNYTLMEWFMQRAKARGENAELDYGVWCMRILPVDVAALSKFADYETSEDFQFLQNLEIDNWDVSIWERALKDGFELVFWVT